jgi:hypothetical protein
MSTSDDHSHRRNRDTNIYQTHKIQLVYFTECVQYFYGVHALLHWIVEVVQKYRKQVFGADVLSPKMAILTIEWFELNVAFEFEIISR